jgi:hypothetical protein
MDCVPAVSYSPSRASPGTDRWSVINTFTLDDQHHNMGLSTTAYVPFDDETIEVFSDTETSDYLSGES